MSLASMPSRCTPTESAALRRRPNILILMSDEHRADVAGYAGNEIVRTPTLDALASTGVVFENAYCPAPICVPGRQAIAAGQLPRTCGVERYGQDLPPFSMTFAKRLSQYGYGTVCCGKLHHDGPDQMQGWMRRIGSNTRLTDSHLNDRDAPSFADRSIHNPYGRCDKDVWEIRNAGVGRGVHTTVSDAYAIRGALDFIAARFADPYTARPDLPTLLMLSFNRPHYPYLTTEAKFNYYIERVQPFLESSAFEHPFLRQRQVVPGKDVTEREIRRATAAYYGMVEEIDDDYGLLLQTLQHAGQDPDEWWIIYTSDHGEMLGEHGVWEKQKFFEGSVRVPLIIRPPRALRAAWGCAGGRVRENVSLCDLFATLCDLAEAPLPEAAQTVNGAGLDSRSLLPLMRGEGDGWFDEAVSQFGGRNLMIKRGDLKYQWYGMATCREQPEVLFDLDADPGERRNAMDDPTHAAALEAFRRRRDALGFGPDVAERLAGGAGVLARV